MWCASLLDIFQKKICHNRMRCGAVLSLVSFVENILKRQGGMFLKKDKRYGYHRAIWENGSREKGKVQAGGQKAIFL